GEHVDVGEQRILLALDVLGALVELVFRQHVPRAEARRPLQRHAHRLNTGPESLNIGVSPWGLRLNEAGRRLRRRRRWRRGVLSLGSRVQRKYEDEGDQ